MPEAPEEEGLLMTPPPHEVARPPAAPLKDGEQNGVRNDKWENKGKDNTTVTDKRKEELITNAKQGEKRINSVKRA